MSRRMIGKLNKSVCGCCDQRAGSGKGKAGMRRLSKRRERQELKASQYDQA
jgi:hypothetical protein